MGPTLSVATWSGLQVVGATLSRGQVIGTTWDPHEVHGGASWRPRENYVKVTWEPRGRGSKWLGVQVVGRHVVGGAICRRTT